MKPETVITNFMVSKNRVAIRLQLFRAAYKEVVRTCQYGILKLSMNDTHFNYTDIDYEYFCEKLGWPYFKDNGIFEEAIELACQTVRKTYCLAD